LCGLLCDEEIWVDTLEALGPRVRAEVFGFANFCSITDMAKHVLEHAPPRFAIAGHSMGGRVALEVFRMAPARVSGVALLNTGIHPTGPHEARTRGELVSIARDSGMGALAARWLPPMLGPRSLANNDLLDRLTRMINRSTPDSFAAQVSALLQRPATSGVLESMQVPVLMLSASEDTWSPPEQLAAMHALVPESELVVIPNAGHMAPAEQPAAVAAALANWIDKMKTLDPVNHLTGAKELEITHACTQLIYRYARFNDSCAWEALSALFARDGTLYRPADPNNPIQGPDEILTSMQLRAPRQTRHVVSNVEVTVHSLIRATSVSTVVLFAAESSNGLPKISSTAVGQFHDAFAKIDGSWLFTERRGQINMSGS
jgi:pimeloyl-ACP methyl ester carboxylesterase